MPIKFGTYGYGAKVINKQQHYALYKFRIIIIIIIIEIIVNEYRQTIVAQARIWDWEASLCLML